MGPLTSATSSWLPQDDILLKNSVEKGASLESLSRGAVPFSRRFTVQELRSRWESILFNDDVSAKASADMVEHECSGNSAKLAKLGGSVEKLGVPAKREFESVRSCYYALRKKARREPFNSMDLGFILTPSNGDDSLVCDSMLVDQMSDQLQPQDSNLDILDQDFVTALTNCVSVVDHVDTGNNFATGLHDSVREYFPIHIEDMPRDISGVGENFHINGNGSGTEECSPPNDFLERNVFQTDDVEVKPPSGNPGILCSEYENNQVINSPISECDASFYDLELEYSSATEKTMWETIDEFSAQAISVDVGIKDNVLHAGDAYANGDSNIKHASTSEYNNNSISKVQDEATGDADASTQHFLAELSISLLNFTDEEEFLFMDADGKEVIDKSYYDGLSSLLASSPENDNHKPLSNTSEIEEMAVSNPHFTEPSDAADGEFANMVSNITIELEMYDSFICCTLNTEDTEIPCNDDILLSGNQKITERAPAHMQKEHNNQKPLPVSSQMVGANITPQVGQLHRAGIAPGVSNRSSPTNNRVDNSLVGKPVEKADDMAERKQMTHDFPAVGVQSHDPDVCKSSQGPELGTSSEPAINHPTSDVEEEQIESDGDLPYFSDIEAMILDMDLAPYDQDLSQSTEVLKYQQEDTKRTIIRLEQGTNVCMQRSIASHGAFAVLYGRNSKHYIKKPEIMLGRSTEDANVDIDLGRESCANKISRQQATIRMDGEGSFYLNNLGKCLISVNGIEVALGQGLKLPSDCLIEIREIPFIFETNHTRVKQYLDSISQEIQP